ncbi:MAG: MFS transporter [Nanoarchaeota archaeon]|nr:MFS transporter [Nanoarchaeota archaeon]
MKLLQDAESIKEVEEDVSGSSKKIVHEKQKALKKSIVEGSTTSISDSIGATYVPLLALKLSSQPLYIGLLSSLSGLVPPFAQLWGSNLMSTRSRKTIVTRFVLLQALMWIPIAILSILFWKGFFQEYLPLTLIILYTVLVSLGSVGTPAWFSWMGDLVPEKDRGKYFSTRNRILGVLGLIATIIAAISLDTFETHGFVFIGFAILFAISFIFRFVSYATLKKIYSPPLKISKKSHFSFWSFLKRFDNYGKFAVYQAFFNFAIMIASPFFIVYMKQELNFDYLTLTIISVSGTVFYLLFSPWAGKFSDRFGNAKLLLIGNAFFVLSPIMWLFYKTPLYLILVPQIISGIGNAAFVIATTNFTYDSVKPEHRGICVAYTNLLTGIGIFTGSILGGLLLKFLPSTILTISSFFFVFILAALARLVVGLIFLPKLKEKRKVKSLPPLHFSLIHPLRTLHTEMDWFKVISK